MHIGDTFFKFGNFLKINFRKVMNWKSLDDRFGVDTTTFPLTRYDHIVLGLIFYVVSVHLCQPPLSKNNVNKNKSIFVKVILFVHNFALFLFSLICFLNTFTLTINTFINYGWKNTICYEFEKLYKGKFGKWAFFFYLSKYYEFMDTYIVILRGRKPILLQVHTIYMYIHT